MIPFPLLSFYTPRLQQLFTRLSVIMPVSEIPFFLLAVAYSPCGVFWWHTPQSWEMYLSAPMWCSGISFGFCIQGAWSIPLALSGLGTRHSSIPCPLIPSEGPASHTCAWFLTACFSLKPLHSRGGMSVLLLSVTKGQAPFGHSKASR